MEDTKTESRRLAAIMFTDMVGFSALTQKDEALALRLLGEHNEIFREVLAKHEGREVKSTGDGFLLEFPSALTAIKCAIEVQQAFHDRNLIEQEKIGVRIGIHVGDVISRDGDILGDGVNIASRIEPLAATGGICVSDAVAQQVQNKIPNALASIGKTDLKNIDSPIDVYKVYMPWDGDAPVQKPSLKRPILIAAAAAALVIGFVAWPSLFPSKNQAPVELQLTESQRLVQQARDLIEDPMAYRESFVNAQVLCERAVEIDPLDGEAYATLARASVVLLKTYRGATPKKTNELVSHVNRAEQLAPDSVETGLAQFEVENFLDPTKGREQLVDLFERFPDDVRIPRSLARFGRPLDDLDDYEFWAKEAHAINGTDPQTLNFKAIHYWLNDQAYESLEQLDRSLAIMPNAEAYHWKLVVLVLSLGDMEAGREFVAQMPAVLTQEDRIARLLFRTWYFSREPDLALAVLESWTRPFLEQERVGVPVSYLRGQAHQLAGRPEAANIEYRAALDAVETRLVDEQTSGEYISLKAKILARLGDTARADSFSNVASQLGEQSDFELLILLGRYDEYLDILDGLFSARGARGLILYQAARYDPLMDPLRELPRFKQIMKKGEAWFNEVVEKGTAEGRAE